VSRQPPRSALLELRDRIARLILIAARPAFAGLILTAIAVPASGQTATPPSVTAGWQDGLFVQSGDGEYRLLFGLVAQADGRFSLDDPKPIIDTFTIRKLRPTFTGRLTRYFTFKVMPDFGNGTAVVQDAYLELRLSSAIRIRTGKDKTPVGYELLQGDAFLWFPERTLATTLVPNRDIGVQLQGDLAGGRVFYAAGIFNGVPDASSSTSELDTNTAKDLAARVVVQPFAAASGTHRMLRGFGFHLGGSAGRQRGSLPSFRTSVGQTYFSYEAGASASGNRTRVSPALFYYYKSFGAFAEYMRSSQAVAKAGTSTEVRNHAWDLTGSVMLTGETASYGIIRPRYNFDPARRHWGALQVLGRYSSLSVDRSAFTSGLAGGSASRAARSFTIAANWYPNAYVKYYATFERTTFTGPVAARPAEDVILFRTQIGF
jgi:phosphate-selective porin OprO and OprP